MYTLNTDNLKNIFQNLLIFRGMSHGVAEYFGFPSYLLTGWLFFKETYDLTDFELETYLIDRYNDFLILKLQISYKRSFKMEAVKQLQAEKMLENFTFNRKKRFAFCKCGRPQGQKNISTLPDHLQNRPIFFDTSPLFLSVDVITEFFQSK